MAGGYDGTNALTAGELYDSGLGTWPGVTLMCPTVQPTGAFQFTFNKMPNGTNTVLVATDFTMPLTNWTALGVAPELAPGLFLFTDPGATNNAQRFYRVRSP